MKDGIGVIEAAWRVDLETQPWLQGILGASRTELDDGFGMWAALYDARNGQQVNFTEIAGVGMSDRQLDSMRTLMPTIPWDAVERTFIKSSIGTLSQLLGREFLEELPMGQYVARTLGIHDALGINAQDVTGVGCVLGIPLQKRQRARRELGTRWSRLAAHVADAFRVRTQLTRFDDAIIEPHGLVAHAEGEARDVAVRTALCAAPVAIDRSRTKAARSDERCLEQWRVMVDGRWSLVDHFDRDGRRYYVARRNTPALSGDGLTPRERQVAGFAALGHSNKLIAYELGLSTSTVATHLSSAAKKLGCTSRVQLISKLRNEP
ncbi:MAG: helix-turn-helix transcriptional regulator [Archangium sp.]